jgi:hypothetical protein
VTGDPTLFTGRFDPTAQRWVTPRSVRWVRRLPSRAMTDGKVTEMPRV